MPQFLIKVYRNSKWNWFFRLAVSVPCNLSVHGISVCWKTAEKLHYIIEDFVRSTDSKMSLVSSVVLLSRLAKKFHSHGFPIEENF